MQNLQRLKIRYLAMLMKKKKLIMIQIFGKLKLKYLVLLV